MAMLKTFFPFAFLAKENITALVIHIIVHVVVGAIAGTVIGLLAALPIVGIIIGALGGLVGLYTLNSLVLCILDYFKILK